METRKLNIKQIFSNNKKITALFLKDFSYLNNSALDSTAQDALHSINTLIEKMTKIAVDKNDITRLHADLIALNMSMDSAYKNTIRRSKALYSSSVTLEKEKAFEVARKEVQDQITDYEYFVKKWESA